MAWRGSGLGVCPLGSIAFLAITEKVSSALMVPPMRIFDRAHGLGVYVYREDAAAFALGEINLARPERHRHRPGALIDDLGPGRSLTEIAQVHGQDRALAIENEFVAFRRVGILVEIEARPTSWARRGGSHDAPCWASIKSLGGSDFASCAAASAGSVPMIKSKQKHEQNRIFMASSRWRSG